MVLFSRVLTQQSAVSAATEGRWKIIKNSGEHFRTRSAATLNEKLLALFDDFAHRVSHGVNVRRAQALRPILSSNLHTFGADS